MYIITMIQVLYALVGCALIDRRQIHALVKYRKGYLAGDAVQCHRE